MYYWPPSGGSGVQRWLFFANYFAKNGLKISVFTPKNPRVAEMDNSLIEKINENINIIYVSGWEPLQNSKNAIGENIGQENGLKSKFMRYVRANFFIPDARIFWAKAAMKSFLKVHKKTTFDMLITSGPPHSIHLIGLNAKRKHTITWIADFRDPWVSFFQNESLPMAKGAKFKHEQMQARVLKFADRVVVTAPSLANEFSRLNKNSHVLTNGYEKLLSKPKQPSKALVYAGSFKAQQNPRNLWRAIFELTQEHEVFARQFSLEIFGKVADVVRREVEAFEIDKWVKFLGYQPKATLDEFLPNANALLLLGINMPNTQNVIHGKLFEYIAAQRPILAIGPKPSDMEAIFREHQLGTYISFDDYELIKLTLLDWFTFDKIPFKSIQLEQFKRNAIAKDYLALILECL